MRIKQGADIKGLAIEMRVVLVAAEEVWRKYGVVEGVTITCGLDGLHSAGSYHYSGYALDLRTRYFNSLEDVTHVARELAEEIELILLKRKFSYFSNPDFDELRNHPEFKNRYQVVVKKTHIHVEYEVDK